jgi:antitoxin (DNA-binding transcriptional repressor) of toxin-antitoxin stability system
MLTIAIEEAKARLPELTQEVDEGQEVLISRQDGAVYQIVRRSVPRARRRVGSGKGLFVIKDSFYDPIEDFKDYGP